MGCIVTTGGFPCLALLTGLLCRVLPVGGQMLVREFRNSTTCSSTGAYCFEGTNNKPEGSFGQPPPALTAP